MFPLSRTLFYSNQIICVYLSLLENQTFFFFSFLDCFSKVYLIFFCVSVAYLWISCLASVPSRMISVLDKISQLWIACLNIKNYFIHLFLLWKMYMIQSIPLQPQNPCLSDIMFTEIVGVGWPVSYLSSSMPI